MERAKPYSLLPSQEAATRPTMRFAELKTEEQLDGQILRWARDHSTNDARDVEGCQRRLETGPLVENWPTPG